jgi:integrase
MAGEYVAPTNLSVRQFVDDRWLPSVEAQVMGGRLKPNTVASYRAQVNSYILPRNVSDAASEDAPRRRKTGKDTMQVWSLEQLRQFLDATRDHRLSAMWIPFITTGLRRGEVAGLEWSDIDLATGHLGRQPRPSSREPQGDRQHAQV